VNTGQRVVAGLLLLLVLTGGLIAYLLIQQNHQAAQAERRHHLSECSLRFQTSQFSSTTGGHAVLVPIMESVWAQDFAPDCVDVFPKP